MDRDKLRDKINRILFHVLSNEERADKIAELIAPELEKAEKWDRVTRAYNSSPPCDCPEWDNEKAECMIETPHCPFNDVVAALEED